MRSIETLLYFLLIVKVGGINLSSTLQLSKCTIDFVHFGVVVGVEEDDAEIVKVEADADFGTGTEGAPMGGGCARDGRNDEHAVGLHLREIGVGNDVPVGRKEEEEVTGRGDDVFRSVVESDVGAGGTEICRNVGGVVVLVVHKDGGSLATMGICQTEQKAEVALGAVVAVSLGTQGGIGVVFATFKHDITDKIESERRMYSIASAMGQTAEPNETAVEETKHRGIMCLVVLVLLRLKVRRRCSSSEKYVGILTSPHLELL